MSSKLVTGAYTMAYNGIYTPQLPKLDLI